MPISTPWGFVPGDVLHLAVASEHDATVYPLDQLLAKTGPALGVQGAVDGMIEPRSSTLQCAGSIVIRIGSRRATLP